MKFFGDPFDGCDMSKIRPRTKRAIKDGFKRYCDRYLSVSGKPLKPQNAKRGDSPTTCRMVFVDFGDELYVTFLCPHCGRRAWIDAPLCCYDDFSDNGAIYPDTIECPQCKHIILADFSDYVWD